VLGFTTEEVSRSPFVQSDVAVAVNAALREAGIEIPFPQRIVRLEQNDNASEHSSDPHRAGAGGNLPPRGGEKLADTTKASPSSGDSLTN
jgi:small-conductance mechanosensitive channel